MTGLATVTVETRLGWSGVALSPSGIRYATLFEPTEAAVRKILAAAGPASDAGAGDPRADRIRASLVAFADHGGGDLDAYPVDLGPCSDFQRRTWLALRDIPKGETRSYGWLARHVGVPASGVRAIGQAMGENPVPPWLPCHRVIAADGSLHGYGGGLALKRELLELEGALPRPLFAL
jgi:methylated-DNA-[protein]-cysteine S-methyltransferase